MEIKRTINGQTHTFTLTKDEIQQAFDEGFYLAANDELRQFAVVAWVDDDLGEALELQDYPPTPENIAALRNACRRLPDSMIECGWAYLSDLINIIEDDLFYRGKN